jgi:hypothetical protein
MNSLFLSYLDVVLCQERDCFLHRARGRIRPEKIPDAWRDGSDKDAINTGA